jgi:hypothetical protein
MKVPYIIGADLSKKTIDFFNHARKTHLLIDNNLLGFQQLMQWLSEQNINTSDVMMVMEHTGLYSASG